MSRLAAVDVGTNSVLLLVAERGSDGVVHPVREEADITRLGRGVDRTGVLSPEGMEATLDVLARFAGMARADGARSLVVTATSAARDARNGAEFLARAREQLRTIPVLLFSASRLPVHLRDDPQVKDLIPKPVEVEVLLEKIRAHCG